MRTQYRFVVFRAAFQRPARCYPSFIQLNERPVAGRAQRKRPPDILDFGVMSFLGIFGVFVVLIHFALSLSVFIVPAASLFFTMFPGLAHALILAQIAPEVSSPNGTAFW